MTPLEAWELVYIDTGSRNGRLFQESTHGQMTCQTCHQGPADRTFATAEEAHAEIVRDPSAPDETGAVSACVDCHADEVAATANSLHTNLWGYTAAIEARCGDCVIEGSNLEPFFDAKCATCHTTCGQCHVSRPNSVGGGFPRIASQYNSHRFRAPDMNEQCTACHGSRIGTDFRGEIVDNVPDAHYSRAIYCDGCHTQEEIHGDGQYPAGQDHYEHRYEVATMPRCESTACHPGIGDQTPQENVFHATHVDGGAPNLQCAVCHAQPYKNCTNCHNLVADEATEKYDINPSRVQLKFARNRGGTPERTLAPYRDEYDIVVVRHVPVDPGTFSDWDGLTLPDYTAVPTWKYASPHNVIRNTPQTTIPEGGTCSTSCHTTPDSPEGWFLRESDLYEEGGAVPLPDRDANLDFVIPDDFPGGK